MKDIYITQSGSIERKDNTLLFRNEKVKKVIPVNDVDSIYAFGEVSINSKLLQFLGKFDIAVHFFNYYGFYVGSFAPKQKNLSGKLIVSQVNAYSDGQERLLLAKEILSATIHNMRKTLMQYNLADATEQMKTKLEKLDTRKTIQDLLLYEAEVRQFYFKQFNAIIKDDAFSFVKRVRQPPDNYINTLISFGNSLLYLTTLSEIFKTSLDPRIAYLHEPFERRYSLNLDLSEIFKPLIVDRVIFSLINRQMIKPEHFTMELNFCHLNEDGRKLFMREYDNKLQATLKYPKLNRNVSYRYMLRLECYKLIRHFIEGKKYSAFRIYW